MALSSEQEAWLVRHMKVEKGLFKKSSEKQLDSHSKKYEEFLQLYKDGLDAAGEFDVIEIGKMKATRLASAYRTDVEEVHDKVISYDKDKSTDSLDKVLGKGIVDTKSLIEKAKKDLKRCEKYKKARDEIAVMVEIMIQFSPDDATMLPILRGVNSDVFEADSIARDGEFKVASGNLKKIKSEISRLEKLVQDSHTKGHDIILEQKVSGIKSSISELQLIPCSGKVVKAHEEALEAIDELRKKSQFIDGLKKANSLEKSVASSREALITYGQSHGLLTDYIEIAEKADKKYKKKLDELKTQLSDLHNTAEGIELKSALKKIKSLLKTGKSLAGNATGGKEQANNAKNQNEAKGKFKDEFDQLKDKVQKRFKEMDGEPSLKEDSKQLKEQLQSVTQTESTGDFITALKDLKAIDSKIDEHYAQLNKFNEADSELTSQLDEIRSLLEKNNVAASVVERLSKQQEKAQELAKTAQKMPDAFKQLNFVTQAAKDVTARLDKYLQVRKTIADHLEIIESVPVGDTEEIRNKIIKAQTDAENELADKPAKATQTLEAVHAEAKKYSENLAKWAKGKGAEFNKKNDEITKLLTDLVTGFDLGAAIVKDMEVRRDQANLFVGALQFDQADKNLSALLEHARAAAEQCKKLDEARRSISIFAPLISKESLKETEKEHDNLMKNAVTGISVGGKAAEESVNSFVELAARIRDEASLTKPGEAQTAKGKLAWESVVQPFEAVYKPFQALPLDNDKPRTLFEGRYQLALDHASKDNYDKAMAALGPLKDLEQTYQPLVKAWETARDAYEKAATDGEAVYTNYASLVTKEELDVTDKKKTKIQAPVISDKGATAEEFDKARTETDTLVKEMDAAITKANSGVKTYDQALKSVTAKLPGLAKDAAAECYQKALAEINKAAQLRSDNKFAAATEILKELDTKGFDELKKESGEKADEWKEDGNLMKEVAALEEEIKKLPSASPVHPLLTDLQEDLAVLKYNVSELREFDNGSKLLDALKKRLPGASVIINEDSVHRNKLLESSIEVNKEFQAYSKVAEKVLKKLKKEGINGSNVMVGYKKGDKIGKYQMFQPASLLQVCWHGEKKAYEDISLKDLQALTDQAIKEFQTAATNCNNLLDDEDFLKAAQAAEAAAKELGEREQAYELARKPIIEALDVCDQRGYEDFSRLNAEFAKLDTAVRKAKTYEEKEYKSEFERIVKDCKGLVDPNESKQIDDLSRDGEKRLRELNASYLAYVKADKYPKGMLNEMSRQLKLAESMLNSGNLPAMEMGIDKLKEIKASSNYMKGFDKGYDHNQKYLKETLKVRLEKKSLNSHMPLTVEQLEKDRLELLEEAENLAPDKHLKLIEKFDQEVKEAQAKAKELEQIRSELKTRRKQVDQALSAIGYAISKKLMKKELLGDFSDKVVNLESEIKSSEDPLEASALMLQFDDIMDKIAYYVEHPSQLAADQQQARQDIADLKQKEIEWKEACKAFDAELLTPAKDAVKREGKRGDVGALEELKKFAKDTREQVLKSHDWKSGESRLNLARDQATQLINEPRGARVSSRKDVAKLAPEWNRVVNAETKTIGDMLGDILKTLKESENKENMKKLQKLSKDLAKEIDATKVMTPFEANAFDRVCAQLGDDNLSNKEHLAMKELGLRVHRKMQAYLDKDPLVQHLRLNPFQGGVLKPVNDLLNNLDLNLRRFG